MEKWHKGTGTIIYDPHRPGLKRRNEWWCTIVVDPEIARYYRWHIDRNVTNPFGQKQILHVPSWGAHISVIRGEKPADDKMHLWKKYHGQTVEFEYEHCPKVNRGVHAQDGGGIFWFVEVKCDLAKRIRDEFGFKSDWLFHMTVGRVWDDVRAA